MLVITLKSWVKSGNHSNNTKSIYEFGVLPLCLWLVVGLAQFCCTIQKNLQVGWKSMLGGGLMKMWQGIKSVAIVEKPMTRRQCIPLLQLEFGVLQCQHLVPQEIGVYLHKPRFGYYMPIQHIFLLLLPFIYWKKSS